jgi:hypothetical protein
LWKPITQFPASMDAEARNRVEAVMRCLLAESLASLPGHRAAEPPTGLTEPEADAVEWDWHFWARKNQLPPPVTGSHG